MQKSLKENKQTRRILCNRLQFLFIDEFQDANNSQFRIFERIIKGGKTAIYAVGDPEQYIFGWASKIRSFENIAINKFKEKAEVETNDENHRSCDEIVKFISQFHCEINQESESGSAAHGGVYFIHGTDLDSIIQSYRDITGILEGDKPPVKSYVSYANKTLEDAAERWGLKPVSNESAKRLRPIDEALGIVSAVVGKNGKQICERYKLDRMELRKKGLCLVQAIREGKVENGDDLESFIENDLGLRIDRAAQRIKSKDMMRRLSNDGSLDDTVCMWDMYSSIHKAKGLQADAVLAVAESKSQLEKWLMTDKRARREEPSDMCRIGYVAFSRAKTILCIACLEKIDNGLEKTIERLGISKR